MIPPPAATADSRRRAELVFAGCYIAVYLGYLFLHPEGEFLHWVSLVLLPLSGLYVIGRYGSIRYLLRSIGIERTRFASGLWWVVVLGAGFQLLQVLNKRQYAELVDVLHAPLGFLMPLLAFNLLVGTVATTEEIFFRGILQARIANGVRSELAGIIISTLAFIAYHVPYAYLNPSWSSAGDFLQALQSAAANGGITGLVLGAVYWRSGRNLLAPVLLHACIDLIPGTLLVHRLLATVQ